MWDQLNYNTFWENLIWNQQVNKIVLYVKKKNNNNDSKKFKVTIEHFSIFLTYRFRDKHELKF